MFNKLIELIIQIWESLIPWTVLPPFERGVILRFGKFVREVGCGFHWMWPFGIEEIISDNVVPAVVTFEPQVVMTSNGSSVVSKIILLWSIKDIKKFLLEVEDADTVLANSAEAVAFDVLTRYSLQDLVKKKEDVERELLARIRRKAANWGVKIHSVNFTHLSEAYILRMVD